MTPVSISVVAYSPDWAERFKQERRLLEDVLSPWLQGGIHHIGSTSVPGLSAKPVIDIICGVRDLEEARASFEGLAAIGYEHAPHRPHALWFFKPGARELSERTHNMHLTEPGSDLWRERLAFRDALRADPALAAEYEELKLRLSASMGPGRAPTPKASARL